jgi:serine/threonine-protein kinase
MPTPSALESAPSAPRTREVRNLADHAADTGGFSLSPPPLSGVTFDVPAAAQKKKREAETLDPDTRRLFHQRLRLCGLIAAFPFAFFVVSGATNFIELFGHGTIGWMGVGLGAIVLLFLGGMSVTMSFYGPYPVRWLRVLEVAAFGMMSMYFAYWQFSVLTAYPLNGYEGKQHERMTVLAAAGIVHFNWFALIVFHGVLVPNSLSRGASITAAMAFAALVIDGFAIVVQEPWSKEPGPTAANPAMLLAVGFTFLAVGLGIAIFGTAKTAALQRQVESAREAIRQLGQYRLRRKLGSGGMGEVYLAEHRLLKRPCAVKRIHARYLNQAEQLKRFEREVQATARLRHPNTVEIYDYGVAEDGTFYYVMEYLPGPSLEDLIGLHGPQAPERVVHILKQLCGALREAHREGLIHRDIKPSNILIFPEGSTHDQVKLLDFGLVQSLVPDVEPGAKITREGLIVGTPEYMSPEQASGGTLDGRSDLFSLGSVAYYLLTGREAFHRENPMKTLMAVVTDPPADLKTFNPFVPGDVQLVLNRMMEKDPATRYATAAQLEQALSACESAVVWTEDRAARWWAAHPSPSNEGTDLNAVPLREA